jgi:hypothetical protein
MKKSLSVNCDAASTLPFRSFTFFTSFRTTMPSAPREYPICTGTTTWNCFPYTASTSTVVADAAIFPAFSADQLSSSLSLMRTLKPCFFAKMELSFGSSPPFATMSPAYPAYSLSSMSTMLSFG